MLKAYTMEKSFAFVDDWGCTAWVIDGLRNHRGCLAKVPDHHEEGEILRALVLACPTAAAGGHPAGGFGETGIRFERKPARFKRRAMIFQSTAAMTTGKKMAG